MTSVTAMGARFWLNSRMFKAIRITILLLILVFVSLGTWLSAARSTDWNNSLWVKVYPINADGSEATTRYINALDVSAFAGIEEFAAREAERYGQIISRPVRMELGEIINEQPPAVDGTPNMWSVAVWSLKMRWWVGSVTDDQDKIEPDVSIFVRYHQAEEVFVLEDSVGIQKGMFGIVNAYAGRRYKGRNNVVIAHELLHTLGASDKYEPGSGLPSNPEGLAEPGLSPLYPQRYAEIMGGRIALAPDDAEIPGSLKRALIGPLTAAEIRLTD
jgi:hypothetical protein